VHFAVILPISGLYFLCLSLMSGEALRTGSRPPHESCSSPWVRHSDERCGSRFRLRVAPIAGCRRLSDERCGSRSNKLSDERCGSRSPNLTAMLSKVPRSPVDPGLSTRFRTNPRQFCQCFSSWKSSVTDRQKRK